MQPHQQPRARARHQAELHAAADGSSQFSDVGAEPDDLFAARLVHGRHLGLHFLEVGEVGGVRGGVKVRVEEAAGLERDEACLRSERKVSRGREEDFGRWG